MSLWTDLRDTAESAAVVAGNYVLPGSSLITSKLVSDGSKQQLNSDLGTLAQLGSSGAGAWNGNLANYQTAANSVLGSVSPGTTVESLSQATGLSGAQLAKLGITAASLLAGGAAASNLSGSNTGGLTGMTTQDRSGFSSGSADYGPAYYQAIQQKYNQYMPQQAGKDITSDLQNWYSTKYVPNATGATISPSSGAGYNSNNLPIGAGLFSQTAKPTVDQISNAYSQYATQAGGDSTATQQAAIQFLRSKGISDSDIMAAYTQYRNNILASQPKPGTQEYVNQLIKEAASQAGGTLSYTDALNAAQKLGITQAQLDAAKASTGVITPTVTNQIATEQPLYTQLSSSSSPSDIAKAYAQFASAAGGDTQANQEAAVNYLSNLGISNDNILQAYGLFKG